MAGGGGQLRGSRGKGGLGCGGSGGWEEGKGELGITAPGLFPAPSLYIIALRLSDYVSEREREGRQQGTRLLGALWSGKQHAASPPAPSLPNPSPKQ